jgi:hypothetical protein
LAKAGDTVALATPGKTGHYVGNWTVATSDTSPSAPLTIRPAPGVRNPVLDGNHGKATGCQTKACNGPVLTIGSKVHVDISGLTFQDGDHTFDGYGGAISNDAGGTLSISACKFFRNTASDGGAIDNADNGGAGTLTVSGSTFRDNSATAGIGTTSYDGGAIDNADNDGIGTLTVSGSTFTDNSASSCTSDCSGGGGAIDTGDDGGTGTLAVSASTFSGNSAHYGGALATGTGTGTVSASIFSSNTSGYGGAICSGCSGTGTLTVSGSTFWANRGNGNGGAIDNGSVSGSGTSGTLSVSASTFSANSAAGNPKAPNVDNGMPNGYGGAIDNEPTGTLSVSGSTFSANAAKNGGGAINNFYLVWAAADVFNGPCHEVAGGTWNDEGYNIGKDVTCPKAGTGDVSHGAGHLGPLTHNGGPTETMMPLVGNPAIGVIPLNTNVKLNGRSVKLCPTIDQRGVHSPAGKACNAGAVQSPAP